MTKTNDSSTTYTVEVLSVSRSECLGPEAYGVDAEVEITRPAQPTLESDAVIGDVTLVPHEDGSSGLTTFGEPAMWAAGDLWDDLYDLALDDALRVVIPGDETVDGDDADAVAEAADMHAERERKEIVLAILGAVEQAADDAGLPTDRASAEALLEEEVASG